MKKSVYIDTTIPSYYADERKEIKLHIHNSFRIASRKNGGGI